MKIYSVAEVTGYLRELLEADGLLAGLWTSGEVSNLPESARICNEQLNAAEIKISQLQTPFDQGLEGKGESP